MDTQTEKTFADMTPADFEIERELVDATEEALDSLSLDPADAEAALAKLGRALRDATRADLTEALPYEFEQAYSAFSRVRRALYGEAGPSFWQV